MRFPTLASLAGISRGFVVVVAAGLACVLYGALVERRWFRRREYRLDVLPSDATTPVTVLHLSDLHMVRGDRAKARFLASLPAADVTVVTGDFLGEPGAVERVVEALRPVRGRVASYFVLGSNDLFAPRPLNYAWYFLRSRPKRAAVRGRGPDLVALLQADGWVDLDNRRASLPVDGTRDLRRDAPEDVLVARDHRFLRESFQHPRTARRRVDLAQSSQRGRRLGRVVLHGNDEARLAVRDDLRHRAAGRGDDRRAARHRLGHHEPERLVPVDREQHRLGAGEQVDLVGQTDLPQDRGSRGEHRKDVPVPVPLLLLMGDLHRHHEPHPRFPGGQRGAQGPLVRGRPPEKQHEVV